VARHWACYLESPEVALGERLPRQVQQAWLVLPALLLLMALMAWERLEGAWCL
jgi:hypothetical protein